MDEPNENSKDPNQGKRGKDDKAAQRWKRAVQSSSEKTMKAARMLMQRLIRRDKADDYCQRLASLYKDLVGDDPPPYPLPRDIGPITAERLESDPGLQAKVAAATAYTPSKWLLEQELSRRDSNEYVARTSAGESADAFLTTDPRKGKSWTASEDVSEDVYDAARRENLAGLSFSGGGVRSASFCLGVMQGLAQEGKLRRFDYISSVSGGSYIHQWLASWIANAAENPHKDKSAFAEVNSKLVPLPEDTSPPRTPEQINWLRRYSSYLTPRRGLLSADTWTMAATWFRNTFLNQIVLFSFLALCLIAARALTTLFGTSPIGLSQAGWFCSFTLLLEAWSPKVHFLMFVIFLIWLALSALWLLVALRAQTGRPPTGFVARWLPGDRAVALGIVLPGFLLSVCVAMESLGRFAVPLFPGSWKWLHTGSWQWLYLWLAYVALLTISITLGGLERLNGRRLLSRKSRQALSEQLTKKGKATYFLPLFLAVSLFVPAALAWLIDNPCVTAEQRRIVISAHATANALNNLFPASAAVVSVRHQITSQSANGQQSGTVDLTVSKSVQPCPIKYEWILATIGPAAFFFLQFLALRIQTGLMGRAYEESRREWLARYGAWGAMICAAWMLLVFIARLGGPISDWFLKTTTPARIASVLGVIISHAVTLYSGASSKTNGQSKQKGFFFGFSTLDFIGIVGAPLCILLLLIVVSGAVDYVLGLVWRYPCGVAVGDLAVVTAFVLFGLRVDVNDFSMHGYYRNRLARCYLGANNPKRNPDPFTGLDDKAEAGARTNITLSSLLPKRFGGKAGSGPEQGDRAVFDGPFPIFCSTINLTSGEDLGTQERKGASFAFTPLFSGYNVGWTAQKASTQKTRFNGFVPTDDFAYKSGGIALSSATAISGAALNPNQGFSSNPALAFLMTLFNVRLGWWIANPRRPKVWPAGYRTPTPPFGLRYLLSELLGLSNDTSNYVNLCDGGQFENMGAYELVGRRCRLIVICDAERDSKCVFEGIGGAIAKARADFGAEITLDLNPLIPDRKTGKAKAHFAEGTIRYPAPKQPKGGNTDAKEGYTGTVIYLKTSLTGDEPGDILHHKLIDSAFPNDTTLNQWFTESDFESYRRLGQHIAVLAAKSIPH